METELHQEIPIAVQREKLIAGCYRSTYPLFFDNTKEIIVMSFPSNDTTKHDWELMYNTNECKFYVASKAPDEAMFRLNWHAPDYESDESIDMDLILAFVHKLVPDENRLNLSEDELAHLRMDSIFGLIKDIKTLTLNHKESLRKLDKQSAKVTKLLELL